MPLERFIPKSPDPFIRNSQDFEVAKFGHLNTIIEYISSGFVGGAGLKLSGDGLISNSLKEVLDSAGNSTPLRMSSAFVTNYGSGAVITNTVFGNFSMASNTTGNESVCIGHEAGYSNTTGNGKVAIGYRAGYSSTTVADITAIGRYAAQNLTNSNIIALGAYAAMNAPLVTQSTVIGYASLLGTATTNVLQLTTLGYQAARNMEAGSYNTAIGSSSMAGRTTPTLIQATGSRNTAVGWDSMRLIQSGSSNVAVGAISGQNITTGTYNVSMGDSSLVQNTTGTNNVAIGTLALNANVSGNNNTAIGSNTVSGNFSGSTLLGFGATATADNQFVVGSSSVNAGTIDTAAVTPTQRWKVKINGIDYYIALQPA